eukprot:9141704-Prorocentrum_lima.AAC.1
MCIRDSTSALHDLQARWKCNGLGIESPSDGDWPEEQIQQLIDSKYNITVGNIRKECEKQVEQHQKEMEKNKRREEALLQTDPTMMLSEFVGQVVQNKI